MAEDRPSRWREMRVFISSTFRDMQAERDHLVRFVFPRLREELLRRRIHFVDVDLRWGVTADQDAFELCMDEIDRCRPRFICMLGGRYGWVPPPRTVEKGAMRDLLADTGAAVLTALYEPDEANDCWRLRQKPTATSEVEQWNERSGAAVELLRAAGVEEAERSITASEVLHGALEEERLGEPTYRYFYFREPVVPEGIPGDLIGKYGEPPGSFAESALERLKERIRAAEGKVETAPGTVETRPLPVYSYSCSWDSERGRIAGLKRFGELVFNDILESADAELGKLPEREGADAFAEENAFTEEFVETRVDRYVVGSRRPLFDALHEHAGGRGGNAALCVVGTPGSGKSALLAHFYREYVHGSEEPVRREPHPDDLVIAHFVGANATNVRELLRRLCHEVAAGAGVAGEIPADYDGLRDRFPELLQEAAGSRRVVLLIDAVNQLDPVHGGPGMKWLPDPLPEGVRVILSALASPALDALRGRAEPPIEEPLGPLEEDDANAIIDSFLARYRKQLDPEQRNLMLAKEDVRKEGSPLYLRTALEELRTLGTYREIKDRIDALPGEVLPLFHWILVDRLEPDEIFRDEQGRPIGQRLVRAFCSYLAIGRDGMSETELAELIAPGDAERGLEPDSLGNVAALRALLRPYLMRRGELLDFFHGQLREAIEGEYLDEEHERLEAHRAVADYFRRKADPAGDRSWDAYPRGLSELPYHLTEGAGADDERWEELQDTLTDFRFLERKAADVGAVEQTDAEGNTSTTYTGVFMLQDDFERALRKLPGGDRAGASGRRPIFVTGTDLGDGLKVRCPHCNEFSDFEEAWRGREETCPKCAGPWKVNDFLVERPARA